MGVKLDIFSNNAAKVSECVCMCICIEIFPLKCLNKLMCMPCVYVSARAFCMCVYSDYR